MLALDELRREETQRAVRDQVVEPLVKVLLAQLLPYLALAAGAVVAILLVSLVTLVLSGMLFYSGVVRGAGARA